MWAVSAFEGGLQPVVELGKCGRTGVQRLVFNHAQLGNESVDLVVLVACLLVAIRVVRTHAATLPDVLGPTVFSTPLKRNLIGHDCEFRQASGNV